MRLRATIFSLTTVVLGLLTASCDSAIYDSAGACSVAVKFKYDYNMKFADAMNFSANCKKRQRPFLI